MLSFALDIGKIVIRRFPAPAIVTAKDAVRKLMKLVPVLGSRIWRESAVPHHLRRYTLLQLFCFFSEDLEIGVAVGVDKAGGNRHPGAIDGWNAGRRVECAYSFDRIAGNQQVAPLRGRAAAVNERTTAKEKFLPQHILLDLASGRDL